MADESKKQSWWTTLPGILTATASVISATTGLIIALQTGQDQRENTPVASEAPEEVIEVSLPELELRAGPRPTFQLTVGSDGSDIPDAQMVRITEALRDLSGGRDAFVILSRTDVDSNYIQTIGGPEDFTLEYRDGDGNRHFQCQATKDQVIDAFAAYRATDPSFRSVCEWKWLDLGQ